jgi:DNA-binding response OmpR family regulator
MTDQHQVAKPRHSASHDDRSLRRGPSVLLVDPSWDSIRPLAAALSRECEVAFVRSAQEAFAAMSIRVPDMIVTELDLPDISGADFLARVHGTPATYHVLLLIVTQRHSVRDKIGAFQAGADDYLVKPVDPREFVKHVHLLSRFQRVIGRG